MSGSCGSGCCGCFGFGGVSAPRAFGPCSAASLVFRHPALVNCAVVRESGKALTLLRHSEVGAVRALCEAVPEETLSGLLPEILRGIERHRIPEALAPVLNDVANIPTLAALMGVLDAGSMVMMLNAVPSRKLRIILGAPPDSLAKLVSHVQPGKVESVLIPVLQEPDELLRETLVPLLRECRHPERIAAAANHSEPEVLFRLIREVEAWRLAALVDALDGEDFEEEGAAVVLLRALADERGLLRDKAVPLVNGSDPATMATLIQKVSAQDLLDILRRVEVSGLQRLLENTNVELVVRIFNGPLEHAVGLVAGGLAEALRNPVAAKLMKNTTDSLGYHMVRADRAVLDVQEAIRKANEAQLPDAEGGNWLASAVCKAKVLANTWEQSATGAEHKAKLAEAVDKCKAWNQDITEALNQKKDEHVAFLRTLAHSAVDHVASTPSGRTEALWDGTTAAAVGAEVGDEASSYIQKWWRKKIQDKASIPPINDKAKSQDKEVIPINIAVASDRFTPVSGHTPISGGFKASSCIQKWWRNIQDKESIPSISDTAKSRDKEVIRSNFTVALDGVILSLPFEAPAAEAEAAMVSRGKEVPLCQFTDFAPAATSLSEAADDLGRYGKEALADAMHLVNKTLTLPPPPEHPSAGSAEGGLLQALRWKSPYSTPSGAMPPSSTPPDTGPAPAPVSFFGTPSQGGSGGWVAKDVATGRGKGHKSPSPVSPYLLGASPGKKLSEVVGLSREAFASAADAVTEGVRGAMDGVASCHPSNASQRDGEAASELRLGGDSPPRRPAAAASAGAAAGGGPGACTSPAALHAARARKEV
eukprot:CAMPEP_0203842814 /NCGR_PEP_ID=MMETSP0359-20131031/2215_1 /ASSEMBLY_ACC=CAM_ASM_000338 /TAXON_ID=268821 /ORGANISM="Scrippsiella Hangoei, Strain SHTV-5" /LENGTH=819 /DNA_ID=CAMNT_0050757473 /DNA_START=49 /DNA_END=2508 /DNA_ORIENTATION=-